VLSESVWPGVQAADKAPAAATGLPWIDANGWHLRRERARGAKGPIWLMHEPPANARGEAAVLAIADAESQSGRWVVRLAPDAPLPQIFPALAFFQKHQEWRTWKQRANVLVVSGFAGENEMLGGEILNLSDRRLLPVRAVLPAAVAQSDLSGVRAVIAMDAGTPDRGLSDCLLRFAADGGLLLTGHQWSVPGKTIEAHPRFRIVRHGRGRIAVSTEDSPDPYNVAGDAHILLSHGNDLFRLHNPGSILAFYSASNDGRRDLLQLVSYATRRTAPITVWLKSPARGARLWTLNEARPQQLDMHREGGGYEFHIAPFSVYAALERDLG
jgi:hypothetical protein